MSFVERQIAGTKLFRPWSLKPRASVLEQIEAFVTGSDQVWRTNYGDVSSYMFDFLHDSDIRPRIAYAASFGSDPTTILEQLTVEDATHYLERFDSVTCREQSGVDWINSIGLDCEIAPDPTLLYGPADYERLISETTITARPPISPYLFAYVLDHSEQTKTELSRVADDLGLELVLASDGPLPGEEQRISVEYWLELIRSADAVITDSYHGMLFSSIFQQRFAVIPNQQRGLDRFTTFASTFGVEDRLCTDIPDTERALSRPLPTDLRIKLASVRQQGRKLLMSALREVQN